MKKKHLLNTNIVVIFLLFSLNIKAQSKSTVKDVTIEQKINDLLSKMTLQEKIGQMNQYNGSWDITGPAPGDEYNKPRYDQLKSGQVGSMLNVISVKSIKEAQKLAVENSRLGIPLIFGHDVIHGYQTIFPIPLGESASWDLNAIEMGARVAAVEAAAAGINWTFAPMVDISRDPRWGRGMEGAGEDPYFGSLVAAARVKGFQGDDLSADNTIAACAKHFAAYGFAEGGRDYNSTDFSETTLRNIILPPFKACVDAGVATFMNGFNDLGGVPATGSKQLQRDILKGEWSFDGFVVSDWGSIGEMIPHGFAKDKKHAAEIAVNAGSDMDMESVAYIAHLEELVKEGKVEESKIDDAVRRILKVKFDLGLFDDPYKYCNDENEKSKIYTKEHLAIARDVAKKSIVLLKNENNILPLNKKAKSIGVIGALANDKDVPLGNWRSQGKVNSAVSLLEGIKNALSDEVSVEYAEGYKLTEGKRDFLNELTIIKKDESQFEAAIALAKKSEVVVVALGEDAYQSGEGRSQANIDLAGSQQELIEALYEVNKNIVVVLMNGRPLVITWIADNIPGIIESWHLGSEAGNAIADVLFGDYNPSGKLPVTFPRNVGQIPLYYNHRNTGRPGPVEMVFWAHYTDETNDPLYPFGFGLSYADFEYSDIVLAKNEMSMNEDFSVSIEIKNKAKVTGTETVQLYIQDLYGSITRPVKELKEFQQVAINAGESKKITFKLSKKDLGFYGLDGKWVVEPGDFKIFIGGNSRDVKEASFELK